MSLLTRRVLPSTIVALSRIDAPARMAAAARRRAGRRGTVELYVAFDDPCSAVALVELADRVRGRAVTLLPLPVVARGIEHDPAVEAKRAYAVVDAARLARRYGRTLGRTAPLPAGETAFLAEWVAATPPGDAVTRFCVAAIERLWLGDDGAGDGPVRRDELAGLWLQEVRSDPPASGGDAAAAVARNERRMRRRGPYDTPAAWIHGRWFFAHDRLDQIETWLDELGWTA